MGILNRHSWVYPTSNHRVCSECGAMQVLKSDNLNTYFQDVEDFEAFHKSVAEFREAQYKHAVAVREGPSRALAWLKETS